MSRQAISGRNLILRALSQWPKDTIRPELQLQQVLQKRFEQPDLSLSENDQLRQANAMYSLLDDRYKNAYPITGSLLQPKSNPDYYTNLLQEIENARSRTIFGKLWLRIKGAVRLQ